MIQGISGCVNNCVGILLSTLRSGKFNVHRRFDTILQKTYSVNTSVNFNKVYICNYIFISFHFPIRNIIIPAVVIKASVIIIAKKTPVGPNLKVIANRYAKGI